MIDPTRISFPKMNKTFLKGIFWLLVFVFLASIFSSAQGIYDKFLRKPEVRKETIKLGHDVHHENRIWIQRAIIIHNRGNEDAKNVQIKCQVPNGEITRLNLISEEDYLINEIEGSSNICSYSLSRLAAGSKVVVLVWSTVSTVNLADKQKSVMPIVSASFDGGIAVSSDRPTALEEIQGIGNTLTKGIDIITQQLNKKTQVDLITQQLVSTLLPLWGIYFIGGTVMSNTDVRNVLITAFMLISIAWLLLPRVWASLLIAGLISLIIWLFVGIWIAAIWFTIPIVLGILALWHTRSRKEMILLIVCLVSIGVLLFNTTTVLEWDCLFSNGFRIFACPLTTIHGGIFFGYLSFTFYLVFVDL